MRTMVPLALAVPVARWWVDRQQRRILESGVPLTSEQEADASRAGVAAVERVRVERVAEFPTAMPLALRWLDPLVRWAARGTLGITFGYGLAIRTDCRDERAVLVHEFVHVAQYERLGGTEPFLRAYLGECCSVGYAHAPLEREAVQRAAEICARAGRVAVSRAT